MLYKQQKEKNMDKIAAFLSNIPLFRGIREEELPLLLKQFNAEIKRFGKDNN